MVPPSLSSTRHTHTTNTHLSFVCATVHVTDFGLARAVKAQNYGKTTGGLGAIKWLAPEAITTNRYDQRTEAYRCVSCVRTRVASA
jgi:hypothetical protein